MNSLTNFIKCYENILETDVCSQIIKTNIDDFQKAYVHKGQIDFNTRRCYQKPLDLKFEKDIFNSVGKVLQKYNKEIPYLDTLKNNDTGYTHLLYKEQDKGEYKEHVDEAHFHQRTISCSFILNDNYEGGLFSFFQGSHQIKPIKGSAILFPSNFCFPHAVTPVTEGNRHAIITWIY